MKQKLLENGGDSETSLRENIKSKIIDFYSTLVGYCVGLFPLRDNAKEKGKGGLVRLRRHLATCSRSGMS